MQSDREVIAVRAEETLDTGRLEPWLRRRLPKTDGSLRVAQFGGGHANLTYLIGFGETEYVLRRPPLGHIAPTSHDMLREHSVLKDLSTVFPLAPRSFAVCEDASIIGAPFHVMERRLGFVIRTQLPDDRTWPPALNRRVGEMLVDALAALHRVSPEAAGLGDLGRPEGFVARQLEGWSKRWHAAKHEDNPAVSKIIAWLERDIPTSAQVSLLHNDFKLDNVLVDFADPANATAILDWDMCTRGDPLMDLGYTLTFWGEAGDDPRWIKAASMPTWNEGFPSRADVTQRYALLTGFDCARIHWYQIFVQAPTLQA